VILGRNHGGARLPDVLNSGKLMKPMDSADWAAKQRLKAPAHQLFLKTLEPVMKTYRGISACRNIMLLVGKRPAKA
jgi:hypothetical protein